jgi:6-phosphogluconolactonase
MSTHTSNFYVGTYTQAADHVPEPEGKGVVSCSLNLHTGEVSTAAIYTNIENPAWLHWQDSKLYAAFESFSGPSAIYQFNVENDHSLRLEQQVYCAGISVCHLTTDENRLYSAAYTSGQLDCFDITRKLAHLSQVRYQGNGPRLSRQQTAHAHQVLVSADKRWLYVCDLGSDCIWRHSLKTQQGEAQLGPAVKFSTPAGTGPRHMVFHPNNQHAYLLTELTAELLTFDYHEPSGDLKLIDQRPSLPTDYAGTPSAAAIAIHPGGRALYCSNRQHDCISRYSIDDDGLPTLTGRVTSGGLEPRAICVDPTGSWLLVANQNSHSIVTYKLDRDSGQILGDIAHNKYVGTPVCIAFKHSSIKPTDAPNHL